MVLPTATDACSAALADCPFSYAFGIAAEPLLPDGRVSHAMDPGKPQKNLIIRGDQLVQHGQTLLITGHVTVTHRDTSLSTSSLTYDQASDTLTTKHDVQLKNDNILLLAEQGVFNIRQKTGELKNVRYKMRRVRSPSGYPMRSYGTGYARFFHIEGNNRYHLDQVTYSTCPSDQKQWFISANSILIDVDNHYANIKNAVFHFYDKPILFLPHLSIPLSTKRRSGFLAPTYTQNSLNGVQLTIPYYFNVAPNYDVLWSPILLQKRGVAMQQLFRLLTPKNAIEARLEYLYDEKKPPNHHRYAYFYRSYTRWNKQANTTVDINHVSDTMYLADIPNQIGHDSAILLPERVTNTWVEQENGNATRYQLILQHYQLATPHTAQFIDEPYDLWPRVSAQITRYHRLWTTDLGIEITRFQRHQQLAGWRFWFYPQLSWPRQLGPLYLTPKVGLHLNTYYHDAAGLPTSHQQVSIPVLSVDATTQLERSLLLFGHHYIQTVEPHAYYLYIPYRAQNHCPVFDTRPGNIDFPTIFGENGLLGKDRVLDANQLTWGTTTRLLNDTSGREYFVATLAQRLYFDNTHLLLPPVVTNKPLPDTISSLTQWQNAMHRAHSSDWLASISSDITKRIAIDGLLQVGTGKTGDRQGVQVLSVATRYRWNPTHLLNVGYQYDHFGPTQIMLSGQTAFSRHWHAIGSINYTLRDNTYNVHTKNFVSESTLGLEYINCCWAIHISMTYSRSPSAKPVKTLFLQFELSGLARVGQDITQLLKSRVPGYYSVTDASSFFGHPEGVPLN